MFIEPRTFWWHLYRKSDIVFFNRRVTSQLYSFPETPYTEARERKLK